MSISKIKEHFHRIKKLGYVDCSRPLNKDGGIGNTYEDLVGVIENNKKEADYLGFEIKSKRQFNQSYISLFSKSPSYPKRANTFLKNNYGEIRDSNFPNNKKLYASVFANRYSIIYGKYKMRLRVDKTNKILFLIIQDLNEKVLDEVYWTFENLEKASKKMKSLLLVLAEIKKENNSFKYHFNKAEIYHEFKFNNFLDQIEKGKIMFDIRIGVYNSGKKIGKTHDHGSGFRIKYQNFNKLYKKFEVI